MQLLIAVTSLLLSAGFAFWVVAFTAHMTRQSGYQLWDAAVLLTFATATIGFAFLAGVIWP
jgi:hypothetical protein